MNQSRVKNKNHIFFLVWKENFQVPNKRYDYYFILTELEQFGSLSTYYKKSKEFLRDDLSLVREFNPDQPCHPYHSLTDYMTKKFLGKFLFHEDDKAVPLIKELINAKFLNRN